MGKPVPPFLPLDGQTTPPAGKLDKLFDFFPEALFLVNGEKGIAYLKSLLGGHSQPLQHHLPRSSQHLSKFLRHIEFLDANPAAVALYQAESREHLLASLSSRLPEHLNFSFLTSFETFLHEKTTLEIETDYLTLQDKLLHLYLKIIFLYPDDPSGTRLLVLAKDVTEQVKTRKAQEAIYKISEVTHKVRDLPELYAFIHHTVNELVPAKNLYIALADYERALIEFPYSVDEYDPHRAPILLGQGITSYVLKTGEPLLATPEVADQLVKSGDIVSHGQESVDWLGVPLVTDEGIIGVLAVQTYTTEERLSPQDMQILRFVSTQIAMAIERKKAEEEVAKFKALSDYANYGIAILDQHGYFQYCNRHYAQMHGVLPEEILHRPFPIYEILPDAEENAAFQQAIHTHQELEAREVMHLHKKGHYFPVLMNVITIHNAHNQPLFTTLTAVDLTTNKQQNEALRRYAKRLEALHEIDLAIRQSQSPERLAVAALENLQKLVPLEHADVIRLRPEDQKGEILAVSSRSPLSPDPACKDLKQLYASFSTPKDFEHPVLKNLENSAVLSPVEDCLRKSGIRTHLATPMQVNDKLIGLLNVGSEDDFPFSKESLEIIQEIAHLLAIALHQYDLYLQVQYLAITDDLTGIYNRRQLLALGTAEFKRSKRYHKPMSIIMFDPDNFKAINDAYGHQVGDEVLTEVTRRCSAQIRETDIFGRYGGDEFVVILPETGLAEARHAAERLRMAVNAKPVSTRKGKIMLSISLGVTELAEDTQDHDLSEVINRVDVALYAAKRAGRNRIAVL